MKITVAGAGAMGCRFGGALFGAGHDVLLLDGWPEHVSAINARGLRVDDPDGTRVVRVPAQAFPADEPADRLAVDPGLLHRRPGLRRMHKAAAGQLHHQGLTSGNDGRDRVFDALGVVRGLRVAGVTLPGPEEAAQAVLPAPRHHMHVQVGHALAHPVVNGNK